MGMDLIYQASGHGRVADLAKENRELRAEMEERKRQKSTSEVIEQALNDLEKLKQRKPLRGRAEDRVKKLAKKDLNLALRHLRALLLEVEILLEEGTKGQ